jgi:hypothetical protein
MHLSQTSLIKFLWTIIGVLVVGLAAVTIIALTRAQAIDQARINAQGAIDSLKEQVRQAKAGPAPTQTPLAEATTNAATPTPSVVPTPVQAVKTPVKTR